MTADERNLKSDTTAAHAGRMSEAHFGAVSTPVYRASTILFPSFEALEADDAPYTYGRRATPTSRSFELAMTELEGGAATFVCPSGGNAVVLAFLAVLNAGDHVLVVDTCYGPTRLFCDKFLKRMGVETTYYDPKIGVGIEALFRGNTRAVFCESPGSLTFEVQDVPAIADIAHRHGASVLLDNTWATPLLFAPFAHGVDLSIQAATKYVGGHSDILLGYVCANETHAARLASAHECLCLYASGDDCYLALRGLRTMPLRLRRHGETALALTSWLSGRSEVESVLYPALPSSPDNALWKRDFTGASGLFGFQLKPVLRSALAAFLDGLTLFGIGYSWGGFESLIVTSHPRRAARELPRPAGPLLRIHAGLEDAGDLIADLERGFDRLNAAP
jgi:cystathionine beta-lyase